MLGLEDEALLGDEGHEELEGRVHLRQLAVDALQRLVGAREQGGAHRSAPGEAALGDQLAQPFRAGAEERRAGGEVELFRGRVRFEEGVDPVAQLAAPPLAPLALVERDQLDGAAHVEGIEIARGELEDALLQPIRAGRSRHAQDAGGHQIDRN